MNIQETFSAIYIITSFLSLLLESTQPPLQWVLAILSPG